MASLKSIRKRITSVKATQKITRAMKMVAGARLNRAQQRIVALRPFAVKTQAVMQAVATSMIQAGSDGVDPQHPLLARRPEKKIGLVVLSSDRGLCGAFNTNITKAAERTWREHKAQGLEVQFITIGRKGREFLSRRQAPIVKDFPRVYDSLSLDKAKLIASFVVSAFEKEQVDSVYLIYNEFKSAITQRVVIEPLLPVKEDANGSGVEYIYEPDQRVLLERLVPMYVETSIYRALLESQASELGARMSAMDAATRNAKEMIARLTLSYNRARQAAITKELMEIIGGAEALKE